MTEPIKLPDLKSMTEAFSRLIEAHQYRRSPFHSLVVNDAIIALRELRSLRTAIEQATADLRAENFAAFVEYQSVTAALEARAEKAEAERDEARAELAGHKAARMAYASEFPLNEEGEPDVGSIHQNIRALKAELARLTTKRLWVWRNFSATKRELWVFDNPFPVYMDSDDPQTIGEPYGYAIFKPSRRGRADITDEQAEERMMRTPLPPVKEADK